MERAQGTRNPSCSIHALPNYIKELELVTPLLRGLSDRLIYPFLIFGRSKLRLLLREYVGKFRKNIGGKESHGIAGSRIDVVNATGW